jgi:hypothetical protein
MKAAIRILPNNKSGCKDLESCVTLGIPSELE